MVDSKVWDKLVDIFLEKNQQLNLSAIRDREWVMIKHVQDSLEVVKWGIINSGMNVVDIGTWGGFPLMPLALEYPTANFIWIDSVKKKTVAVNEMIEKLWITNAKVKWGRIEEFNEEKFDIVIGRAVAYADKLLKWSYHLLKQWGVFIFMKQKNKEERDTILRLLKQYKLKLLQEHAYSLFDGDIERVLYVLEKL